MTDFLNKEKCKFEEDLEDWEEFGLCTGLSDCDIIMYCFHTECEGKGNIRSVCFSSN